MTITLLKASARHAKSRRKAFPPRAHEKKRSEHLTNMVEWMTKGAAKSKELAETLKPLYASLSEEQKAVAGRALDPFLGDDKGPRGPRSAMQRGGSGGPGHGHGGRGPEGRGPGMTEGMPEGMPE